MDDDDGGNKRIIRIRGCPRTGWYPNKANGRQITECGTHTIK